MMKFYARNFTLLIIIAFLSILSWLYFVWYFSNATNPDPTFSNALTTSAEISINASEDKAAPKASHNSASAESPQLNKVRNIVCHINQEYKVNCLKLVSTKEVYVPFSLIHKYFEIYGKIVRSKGQEYFEWEHSNAKIYFPDQPYNPAEKYLWFENYNVEIRDRVKWISATENVPMSNQWYARGHFYPTQIGQYGLSHFSKNISESPPKTIVLIKDAQLSTGVVYNSSLTFRSSQNLSYFASANTSTLFIQKEQLTYSIVEMDLRLTSTSSISFYLVDPSEQQFCVQYDTSDTQFEVVNVDDRAVKYGIGSKRANSDWFTMTRDLAVDVSKSNLVYNRKRLGNYRLDRIQTTGQVHIRSLRLLSSAHGIFARAAADWFVEHQNSMGGWDIKVDRRLQKSSGGMLLLRRGWHSSMAQGQAMSLLTRLYSVTNDTKYLVAAKKALTIFEVESFKNGIKAMFFDKYVWYEEYPTVPSIFVLNGFIYSLFGLYDLSKTCSDRFCQKAALLFEEGIRSLEAMLPMYDSGSGSFYDLRHLSLTSAPNVARWDYHTTHINQLLTLYTIVRRDILQITADRWIGYMKGHRAPHN